MWTDFSDESQGHEQQGRRPALVLSVTSFNEKLGLAIVCPVTSQSKNFPFEIPLPDSVDVSGVVLADQVRSIDWVERNVEFVQRAPDAFVEKVTNVILAFFG